MENDVGDKTGELAEALGAVVINFGGLEESLRDAIKLLADSEYGDSDGKSVNVLTSRMSFQTLVDSFGALCTDLGTAREDAGDYLEYCRHLNKLNSDRNRFIHSAWNVRLTHTADSVVVRRIKRGAAKPNSGFRLMVADVDVDEVWRLAKAINAAEQKLWEYVPP